MDKLKIWKYIYIILLLFNAFIINAQIQKIFSEKIDSNWYFGQYVGIDNDLIIVEGQNFNVYQSETLDSIPFYFYKKQGNVWKYSFVKKRLMEPLPGLVWGDFATDFKDDYWLTILSENIHNKFTKFNINKKIDGKYKLIKEFVYDSLYSVVNFGINKDWLIYRLEKFEKDTLNLIDYFFQIQDHQFVLTDSFINRKKLNGEGYPKTIKCQITDKYTVIGNSIYDYIEKGSGKVTIYKREGKHWKLSQEIYHPEILHTGNRFGMGTEITDDNKYIFVSAMYSKDKVPKVYVYKNIDGKFELFQKISEPEAFGGMQYGNSMNYEDGTLLVGSYNYLQECVVFQYALENGKWVRKAKIKPPQGMESDFFGVSIARQGETVVVGASYDETYHSSNGAAYIFQIPARDTLRAGICEGESYAFNDTVIYDTGHYTDTLLASYGVDSVVQLYLTVYPKEQIEIDTVLCDGQQLIVGDSVLTEEGIYTIILKNQYGCDSVVTVKIEYDDIEVDDSITADYGCQNGEIRLSVQGNNPPYAFNWTGGQRGENISGLSYGKYDVTITSHSGCVYDYEYEVGDSVAYLIPNAFFPSGQEELNATFKPYTAKDVHILSIEIYDRWGEKVFSGAEDEFWDGTYKGKMQSPGVYLYRIEIDSPCGEEVKIGQVVLLR